MQYPVPDLADFVFFLLFFVAPGLFSKATNQVNVPSSESIPWLTAVLYLPAVIYMMVRYHLAKKRTASPIHETKTGKNKVASATLFLSSTLITYIQLSLCSMIVSKIAAASGFTAAATLNGHVETDADNLVLVLWVILLATFEEFTYRWLLPVRLRTLWVDRRPEDGYRTTRTIIAEAAIICLFALSHRYMNWWAVLNAFLAGIILRTRFFVTGSVYPALISHILYNLSAFYGIL